MQAGKILVLLLLVSIPVGGCGSPKSLSDLRARLSEAHLTHAQGDHKRALDMANSLERESISDPQFRSEVMFLKVSILENLNRWKDALKTAERCVRLYPNTVGGIGCQVMIPDILVHLGRKDEAIRAYDALIEEWKGSGGPGPGLLQGMVRERAKLSPEAAGWLRSLLRDKSPFLRAAVIGVMKNLYGERAASEIRPLLADPAPLVKVVAAGALWELGDRSGLESILALARSPEFLQPASPGDSVALMREEVAEEVIEFLVITRDPVAEIEVIRILRQSQDYGLMSRCGGPASELAQLDPWSVSYLIPLLDDRQSTGIHSGRKGWDGTMEMRVCDIAAALITDILADRLPPYGNAGTATVELDAQIADIKTWWKENSNKYPIPPEAKAAAEKAGL